MAGASPFSPAVRVDRSRQLSCRRRAPNRRRPKSAERRARLRADRRQHHARAQAGRLSAQRPALVRRFLAALLRMAPARRRRGVDLGRGRDGGAPRKLSDEERRNAPPVARPLGRGPPPRPLRRSRRHRPARLGGRHAPPDHAHDRRRGEPAVGAQRNAVTFTRDNNLFIVPLEPSGELVAAHRRRSRRSASRARPTARSS